MIKSVFMLRRPIGRLGNQFFQLNLIKQIGHLTRSECFYRGFDDLTIFNINANKMHLSLNEIGYPLFLSKEDIIELFANYSNFQETTGNNQKTLIIPNGLMGEIFFDTLREDPNLLFNMPPYKKRSQQDPQALAVNLHFRGTDFLNWNARAIMPAKYYLDSIDYIKSMNPNKNLDVTLFTDDLNHEVTRFLIENKIANLYTHRENIFQSFKALGSAEYIISSPSTFAFWSFIFGYREKIIYSKQWVNSRIQINDMFWTKFYENQLFNIKIHEII